VIMPNHLDALVDFGVSEKNINTIVSMAKDLCLPVGSQGL